MPHQQGSCIKEKKDAVFDTLLPRATFSLLALITVGGGLRNEQSSLLVFKNKRGRRIEMHPPSLALAW